MVEISQNHCQEMLVILCLCDSVTLLLSSKSHCFCSNMERANSKMSILIPKFYYKLKTCDTIPEMLRRLLNLKEEKSLYRHVIEGHKKLNKQHTINMIN